MPEISHRIIEDFERFFRDLLSSERQPIGEFAKTGSTKHGIYIISDLADNVVYVGRTRDGSNGLRGRANQHINCRESADLNQMLGGNREDAKKYQLRVAEIEELDNRRFAEHFGIAVLKPKFNK